MYLFLINQGLKIAGQTKDVSGKLLAVGITAMLSFQIIVNIGMSIGLMPITGLTLPLVSYGGSSLLVTMISIGILLSIKMRRTVF